MTTFAFSDDVLQRDSTQQGVVQRDLVQRGTRRSRPQLALVQLHDALWRVTRTDGEVLGYIEQFDVNAGQRYRAKRFIARQRRFIIMGEFWDIDDAIDCFGF